MGAKDILHRLIHRDKDEEQILSSSPEKDEKEKNQDTKNIILETSSLETDSLKKGVIIGKVENTLKPIVELEEQKKQGKIPNDDFIEQRKELIDNFKKYCTYDEDYNIAYKGVLISEIKDNIINLKVLNILNDIEKSFHKKIIGVLEKQTNQRKLFREILDVWRSKAYEVSNSFLLDHKEVDEDGMRTHGWRDDANTITDKINEINEALNLIKLPVNEDVFKGQIKEIFEKIFEAEKAEDIIGNYDMKNIYRIFLTPEKELSFKEKELQILNILRYGGWSGNSEGVKDIVADKLLKSKDLKDKNFGKLKELLEDPKFTEFLELLEKKDKVEVTHFLIKAFSAEFVNSSKDLLDSLAEMCIDKYEDIYEDYEESFEENLDVHKNKYYKKYLDELKAQKKQIDEQNKKIDIENNLRIQSNKINEKQQEIIPKIEIPEELNNLENYNFQDYKKNLLHKNTKFKTNEVFKHFFLRQIIEKQEDRGSEKKSYKGIYADMSGLAEEKSLLGDSFDIGDDNIDTTVDVVSMVAVGLMTMGAGMIATAGARTIVSGSINLGAKGLKALKLTSFSNKISKISKIGKYNGLIINGRTMYQGGYASHLLGNAVVEGVAFHVGATMAGNYIYGDKNTSIFHGTTDAKELGKSILFMGALNGLHFQARLLGGGGKVIIKDGEKILESQSKILKGFDNLTKKVPKGLLNPETAKKMVTVPLSGAEMYGMSLAIDYASGEGWNPSLKSYIEFVALMQVMHLKDKISVRKFVNKYKKNHKEDFYVMHIKVKEPKN